MVKEFMYKGKTLNEIKGMELNQFIELLPSRLRRTIKRGFTEAQKKFIEKIKAAKEGKFTKQIKTHCRNMPVIPDMIGLLIYIHIGNAFIPVKITEEMLGHFLGELAVTRKKLQHSAPGVGATRSSTAASSKAK